VKGLAIATFFFMLMALFLK